MSDKLNDATVNFADRIIIGESSYVNPLTPALSFPAYVTREYSSGKYTISVEPKRVQ